MALTPYYKTEYGQLYCGDCLNIIPTLPTESIDLLVTSPPYNLDIQYKDYDDNKEWTAYYRWCKEWLILLHSKMKCDGRLCVNHYFSFGQADNRQTPLMEINQIAVQNGYKHHGVAIWFDTTLTKRTAWGSWLSASAPYINSPFEGILILFKNQWKKEKKGETEITKEEFMEATSGVWRIVPERKSEHPAPFPLELPARCIKLLSWKGDVIIDPFMGSGTTALACEQLQRRWIGIEISKEYCDLTISRLKNWNGQKRLDVVRPGTKVGE